MHFYQHNIVNGIHHVSLPAGGAEIAKSADYQSFNGKNYTQKSADIRGYAMMEAGPDTLRLIIYPVNSDGEQAAIDTIVVVKP